MWAKQLVAARKFDDVRTDAPKQSDLIPGEVILAVRAGAVCGSDLPAFRAEIPAPEGSTPPGQLGPPGYPMHEVVGEVVASEGADFRAGDVVVGWASDWNAMSERIVAKASGLATFDRHLPEDVAIALQPLACVLYAVERLGDVRGKRIAIIGLGPIGMLFAHVLKSQGASHVEGVDKIDRNDLGPAFGLDETHHCGSDEWVRALKERTKPAIIVEAVGHQAATLEHALDAVAVGGLIYCFGIPQASAYPLDLSRFLRKQLTMQAGVTQERARMLREANAYAARHPEVLRQSVTHSFSFDDVQDAYELAEAPAPGQLKIALSMT